MNYLLNISETLGISMLLLAVIFVWSFVWKMLALWKSARKGSVPWFIALAILNTVGILEILYLFVFSNLKAKKVRKPKKKR